MAHHDLTAQSLATGIAKPKRQRRHRASLVSVAKQAAKAGLEVARYEIDLDEGKISIVTGKSDVALIDTAPRNEWDTVQ
jgi:hypothetical protein